MVLAVVLVSVVAWVLLVPATDWLARHDVGNGASLILVHPGLHVVWRVDRLLNPDVLAALASGHGSTAVMKEVG